MTNRGNMMNGKSSFFNTAFFTFISCPFKCFSSCGFPSIGISRIISTFPAGMILAVKSIFAPPKGRALMITKISSTFTMKIRHRSLKCFPTIITRFCQSISSPHVWFSNSISNSTILRTIIKAEQKLAEEIVVSLQSNEPERNRYHMTIFVQAFGVPSKSAHWSLFDSGNCILEIKKQADTEPAARLEA